MEMSYILFFHTKLWKSSTFYAYGMYQLGQATPEAAVFTCGQWWLYNSPHLDALKQPEDPKTLTQGIFLNRNLNDFSHPSDMPTTVQNVGKASLGRKPAAGGGKKKKNVGKPKSVTARKELSQSSKNLNSESQQPCWTYLRELPPVKGSGIKQSSDSPQSWERWVTQCLSGPARASNNDHTHHLVLGPTWGHVPRPELEPICWPEIWFALDMEQVKYLFNSVHCTFHYSPQAGPIREERCREYLNSFRLLGCFGEGSVEMLVHLIAPSFIYMWLIYVKKKMPIIILPSMNQGELFLVYSLP